MTVSCIPSSTEKPKGLRLRNGDKQILTNKKKSCLPKKVPCDVLNEKMRNIGKEMLISSDKSFSCMYHIKLFTHLHSKLMNGVSLPLHWVCRQDKMTSYTDLSPLFKLFCVEKFV